jgi:group I intron endonuclease
MQGKHCNVLLQYSWNKYGVDHFVFQFLEPCSPSKCLKREQYWINKLNAYHKTFGFNLRPNAESNKGHIWSEEVKQKMSVGAQRRLQRPGERERLQLISKLGAACNNKGMKGHKHTADTKARISAKLKGRKLPPEVVARIAAKNRGKKMSDKQKLKLSKALTGKVHTEETKAKMSSTQKTWRQPEEGKRKLQKAITTRWADPEQRNQASIRAKKRWAAYRKAKQDAKA